jgi:signal transduction histidine kinase
MAFAVGLRRHELYVRQLESLQVSQMKAEVREQSQQIESLLKTREAEVKMMASAAALLQEEGSDLSLLSSHLYAFLAPISELDALCLISSSGEVLASAFREAASSCARPSSGSLFKLVDGQLRLEFTAAVGNQGERLLATFIPLSTQKTVREASLGDSAMLATLRTGDEVLLRSSQPRPWKRKWDESPVLVFERVGERDLWLELELTPWANAQARGMLNSARMAWYLLSLVLLLCSVLLFTLQWVSSPLADMSEAALEIAEGNFQIRVPQRGPRRVRQLAQSINQMADGLAKLYEDVKDQAVMHNRHVLDALDTLAKKQAAEVANQNRVLQQQNRELERASRLKSEFLANISHELRTPLNAVIGFSDVLLGEIAGPLNDEQQEYLQDIRGSGQHLLSMINDILDLAKIEAGKMDLRTERVELVQVVREANLIAGRLAALKGVKFEIQANEPIFCLGDAQRLKQVALNLISNAVKFTPPGGSIITEVRPSDDGDFAELSVQDTGIGIDPAFHRIIFEQFRQVDGSATREYQGTGLGLALVKRFSEAMGGQVSVASAMGAGSTFTVKIPVWKAEDASATSLGPKPLQLLVAGDAAQLKENLRSMLAGKGYYVQVTDVDSALPMLHKLKPDVLILDAQSAAQALDLLQRRQSAGTQTPAMVMVGAESPPEEVEALKQLGAHVAFKEGSPKTALAEILELASKLQRAA